MGLIKLDIAKGDLKNEPYYYESAFAGREINPFTGSSYRDALHYSVWTFFEDIIPKPDEQGFFMQDWGRWYPS